MNYFNLYPGDYLRDTTRLGLVEHGAYFRLLLAYYAEESGLPADYAELFVMAVAVTDSEKDAVRKIADRYFPVGKNDVRRNNRCDAEIIKARKMIKNARKNGAKGGRPPGKTVTEKEPSGFNAGYENDRFGNPQRTQTGVGVGVGVEVELQSGEAEVTSISTDVADTHDF